MSILDDVISTTKSVAATAGRKTDEAVKFSKLRIKKAQIKGDIKVKFEKLGALVYQAEKSGEKDNDELTALISELDASHAELEETNALINELRNEVACPNCGAATDKDNSFCPKCGTKLPEPPAPAEEEKPAEDLPSVNEDDE